MVHAFALLEHHRSSGIFHADHPASSTLLVLPFEAQRPGEGFLVLLEGVNVLLQLRKTK